MDTVFDIKEVVLWLNSEEIESLEDLHSEDEGEDAIFYQEYQEDEDVESAEDSGVELESLLSDEEVSNERGYPQLVLVDKFQEEQLDRREAAAKLAVPYCRRSTLEEISADALDFTGLRPRPPTAI